MNRNMRTTHSKLILGLVVLLVVFGLYYAFPSEASHQQQYQQYYPSYSNYNYSNDYRHSYYDRNDTYRSDTYRNDDYRYNNQNYYSSSYQNNSSYNQYPASYTPSFVVSCDAPTYSVLRFGNTGPHVGSLQNSLSSLGYSVPTTNVYDAYTLSAVHSYQSTRGLYADGIVGPQTWGAISRDCSVTTYPSVNPYASTRTVVVGYGNYDNNYYDDYRYDDRYNNNYDDVEIETRSATSVDDDSASLRGRVTEEGDGDVRVWFEIDRDRDDVNRGNGETYYISGDKDRGDSFSRTVSGLRDDTRYYFRACGEDRDGDEGCGSILSFTTDN